jgi:tetratricopeptide (TPR) repeat protein
MKKFFIVLFIAALAAVYGCGSKPDNANMANANAEQASQFASITDANQALAEGNRLMDENDTLNAIEAYRRAIELDPDLPEAHFKLGIAYALVEMQMEQEGRASETVDSKGRTSSEKQFEKAVDAYKKWLDKNPDDDVAHYNLGRTYNKLHKDEEAAKEFKQAVKLKPDDTEYQTELGSSLIRLAQYHEAIPPLKKAIELDPGNERAISLLEDAEAGRQRIDYVSNKNTNTSNSNKNSNANVNSNMSSNANAALPPTNANSKPPTPKHSPSPNPTKKPAN